MQKRKIPVINEHFDLEIFSLILKKNYWVAILLVAISISSAFLYIRYTHPKYNAISVLQINEQNQTSMLLNLESSNKHDIIKVIELLRSQLFLKRALSKLPLNVSYYVEGTFLSTEQYKKCPFEIEVNAGSANLYGQAIYIFFDSPEKARFVFNYNEQEIEYIAKVGEWVNVSGGQLRLRVSDYPTILSQQDNYKSNHYFFIANNPQTVVKQHVKNLSISLLSHSAQTIEISYTGNSASKAADIVNSIASSYLKYEVEVKQESSANILQFIEEQLKMVYSTLDQTEKELHAFKKENRISSQQFQSMGTPFPIFTTKINEFEDELINLEFELITLQRISEQIQDEGNINIYELVASLVGTKSEAVVTNALTNLQGLIFQKEQLLNDVTTENLKIKILDKQIANQRALLIDFVQSTVDRLALKKEDYSKKIKEYENKMFSDKSYNELEYTRLERLYSINEGFYHKLIEKKAESLISQAGYVSKNTILEEAQIPQYPIAPLKKKIYPIFLLVGLFLGGAYIIIRYLFYDEITSATSIEALTNAAIVGTVPTYKKEIPVSQLLVDKNLSSVFTEAFRTIRSNLQFISHGAETKIITVTSTISGEGKTFVAINLAGIIAVSGKKVIVLDLDLRKPRIHLGFNVPNECGISSILIGKSTIEECTRKASLENFHYITSGPIPPNPAELANSKSMEDLIGTLEEIYDVIIIDTPPVGIVTDALSNLQRANYPIYVMKANVSKRHFVENVNHLIINKNMANLSIVLNGVSMQKRRYGSYGSYGYGYGYGYYQEENTETKTFRQKLSAKLKKT